MTLKQLETKLRTLNIPVAYDHFSKSTNPPFIVYYEDRAETHSYDNKPQFIIRTVKIEFYDVKKNLTKEGQIMNLLKDNQISFNVDIDYIQSENLYMTEYEIEIMEEI